MLKGIAFALAACFIWGLIFVVPGFMTAFSAFEVALGRFLFFGAISLTFFLVSPKKRYSRMVWVKALYYSLITTIGYYTFVVLGLRYATPAICALILGISPITIAFYGNWKQKEVAYRSLIIPSVLIVCGLIMVNVPHLKETISPSSYILGLGCSFLALAAWSWYVVANARFLKQNPEVRTSEWTTLIGVMALFWVLIFGLILTLFFEGELDLKKCCTPGADLTKFLIGSAILGILCSWVGAFLWNRASLYLPVSFAGQLTIFETIFGVLFFYLIVQQWPSSMEMIGIAILLIAILYGIRQFTRKKTYDNQLKPH